MSAQDDELIKRYREASQHDDARPGAHVRGAVRAHAQLLAAVHASPTAIPVSTAARPAANAARWKISALASVALVGLTGLLVLQFERGTPEDKEVVYGRQHAEVTTADVPPAQEPAGSTVATPAAGDGAAPITHPGKKPSPAANKLQSMAKTAPSAKLAPQAGSTAQPGQADASSLSAPLPPAVPAAEMRQQAAAQAAQRVAQESQAAPDKRHASRADAAPSPEAVPSSNANTAPPSMQESALRKAAQAGQVLRVESLASQGVWLDSPDRTGRTALMLAAMNGQASVVQTLLALGANPALVDSDGFSAAHHARRAGHTRIGELIDAGR